MVPIKVKLEKHGNASVCHCLGAGLFSEQAVPGICRAEHCCLVTLQSLGCEFQRGFQNSLMLSLFLSSEGAWDSLARHFIWSWLRELNTAFIPYAFHFCLREWYLTLTYHFPSLDLKQGKCHCPHFTDGKLSHREGMWFTYSPSPAQKWKPGWKIQEDKIGVFSREMWLPG